MAIEKSKHIANKLTNTSGDLDVSSRLRFEYNILLEEYRIVNGQILHRLAADEKNYDSTIVTFGAIAAASSIIINFKIYFLLLVLAVPLYILIWEQVRQTILGKYLAKYITQELAPRISEIIQTTASDTSIFGKPQSFISWENYYSPLFGNNRTGFVMLLPKAGKASVQFGVAMLLVGIYLYLRTNDMQYTETGVDVVLLLTNFVATLITVFSVSSLWRRK